MSNKQTKTGKTTLLGVAAGLAFAAVWIAVSIWITQEPHQKEKQAEKKTHSQRTPQIDPPAHEALISFRERDNLSQKQLLNLLDSLPAELNQTDIHLLLTWLREEPDVTPTEVGAHAHLVNEVLILLRSQSPLPKKLPEVLISLVQSEKQPQLVRNYGVQHLRPLWNALDTANDYRGTIEETLWKVTQKADSSQSATAFLALHQLGIREGLVTEGERAVSNEMLLEQVRESLADPLSRTSMRLTALRIIEDRALESEVASVRQVVQSNESDLVSRLKAIAALGRVGSDEDLNLLADLSNHPRLAPAVKRALSLLSQ